MGLHHTMKFSSNIGIYKFLHLTAGIIYLDLRMVYGTLQHRPREWQLLDGAQ